MSLNVTPFFSHLTLTSPPFSPQFCLQLVLNLSSSVLSPLSFFPQLLPQLFPNFSPTFPYLDCPKVFLGKSFRGLRYITSTQRSPEKIHQGCILVHFPYPSGILRCLWKSPENPPRELLSMSPFGVFGIFAIALACIEVQFLRLKKHPARCDRI